MSQHLPQGIYVHVGCGTIAPGDWLNLDASWNVLAARVWGLRPLLQSVGLISASSAAQPYPPNIRYCDVTRGLPLKDGQAAVVYSSHMLEHLTRAQARAFVREAYRVLAPGGIIRLVVPDLRALAQRYLDGGINRANDRESLPADQFMVMLNTCADPGPETPITRFYRTINNVHTHKWMYDAQSLKQVMAQAGFVEPSSRGPFDSEIDLIREVEREDRFEHGIAVEARK